MKAIIISVKPQWVEKILNGEKTIEIRKTMPKCELPCKVYIYCTQAKPYLYRLDDDDNFELTNNLRPHEDCFVKDYNALNGKIVAEFTLNKIDRCGEAVYDANRDLWEDWNTLGLNNSCVHPYDLEEYSNGYELYAWYIDNLKIYDKPKELSEFKTYCNLVHNKKNVQCFSILCRFKNECKDHLKPIIRPPQSWCYVEKVEGKCNNI